MGILEVHKAALDEHLSVYHEFLMRYGRRKSVVYGFVEGKEDTSYYKGAIDSTLPADWSAELWPAGNRLRVIQLHSNFDWARYPREQVCFFLDRDLSDLISAETSTASNVYVTDGYSVENSIVHRETCERVLSEMCGFSECSHDEVEKIGVMFEEELEQFLTQLTPVMAWILHWRRRGLPANLNNIDMGKLFEIRVGKVRAKAILKSSEKLATYLHKQCGLKQVDGDCAVSHAELLESGNYRRYARGKFVLWFFVAFCNSVHKDAPKLVKLQKSPKIHIPFAESNAVSVAGPRARLPPSLRDFCKGNYGTFVQSVVGASSTT